MPRDWWATIGLLCLILASAEIGARVLLKPVGDNLWAYESTAQSRSFEWYRHLATSGSTPDIVAIGDSTGARNFDPATFGRAAAVDNVYSLARAGNFPRALRSDTLPLLDAGKAPEIVILMQWPGSLRDDPRVDQIEAGAVSPILEARMRGRVLITDYLYVTRLFPARAYLASYWLRGQELLSAPSGNGFSPFDRETDALPQTRVAGPPQETPVFSEARRDVIRELVAMAQERNFTVVAVVGPFRVGTAYEVANRHLDWLLGLQANNCQNLVVADFRDMPELGKDQFRDNHHLFRDGAEVFSQRLGDFVAALRKEKPGRRNACRD